MRKLRLHRPVLQLFLYLPHYSYIAKNLQSFSFSLQICLSQLDQISCMKMDIYILFGITQYYRREFHSEKHLHEGSSTHCALLLLNIPWRIPKSSAGKNQVQIHRNHLKSKNICYRREFIKIQIST